MPETPEITPSSPERESTPQALRQKLETMGLDYLAYTIQDKTTNTAMLLLATPDGERIRIEKVSQKNEADTRFLKDTRVMITPGSSQTTSYKQIDYNFDQYNDSVLRKRVISVNSPDVERITRGTSAEGMTHLAGLALNNAMESADNLQLEEDMGVNNQPATGPEIAELIALLDKSVVLDPNDNYKPIA